MNKSSSEISENKNKNHFNHKIAEQSSNSNISNSIYNFNDENNKKGLIYNYNQMNKHINKTKKEKNKINNKEYKSQSHSKYYDLMKKGRNKNLNNFNLNIKNSNESISTNDFTKLKYKYLELKNVHDLTLSKLKKEKNKNKKQKEDIEIMINSIKTNPKKENNIEEMNEIINKLKEENNTFRQVLVLSQALINSLKSELKNNSRINLINNEHNNSIEEISMDDKSSNIKLNKVPSSDINELIKEINELNNALSKKNKIIDSVLIENKKLRNELKHYNNDIPNDNNNSKNKIQDLIYNEAINLINKYNGYKNSNKDDLSNLILTENFFKELEKIKEDIDKKRNDNNIEKMIDNFISLINLILNEFDKLLLYNNNFWKEKYLNKYKTIDNNDIKDKKIQIYFDKVKNNLMDLCLLSSSYLKDSTKDLFLEGINLIKNLDNLHKEKNMTKYQNNLNELIMNEEKKLDNIKRKLAYNQYDVNNNYHHLYHYNSNSVNDVKNVLGLTYMTNYYSNNKVS